MRIGEVNQSNYTEYMKLFTGNKNLKQPLIKSTGTSGDSPVYGPKLTNSDGMTGMCITGRTDWKKIVDVSDDIREKIVNLARKEFINNYGMSDGEEQSALSKKYVYSLPEDERLSASWTVGEIYYNEAKRLTDIAKERIPGWQGGQPFDKSIFNDVISGNIFDKKV